MPSVTQKLSKTVRSSPVVQTPSQCARTAQPWRQPWECHGDANHRMFEHPTRTTDTPSYGWNGRLWPGDVGTTMIQLGGGRKPSLGPPDHGLVAPLDRREAPSDVGQVLRLTLRDPS